MDTASAWITRFAPRLPGGSSVLDVACGAGRHARWMLAAGHHVTAVDRDMSRVQDLAVEPRARLIEADLEDGSPWPIGDERFGCVVVTNYLWRELFERILAAVAAGGMLLYETFAVGNERYGKPRNPDFLLREDELLHVVQGELHVIAFEQGVIDEPKPAVVQRICAVRVAVDELPGVELPG